MRYSFLNVLLTKTWWLYLFFGLSRITITKYYKSAPSAGGLLKHTGAINILFCPVISKWNSIFCECFENTGPIFQYAGSTYETSIA